jgi:hypothetical protein
MIAARTSSVRIVISPSPSVLSKDLIGPPVEDAARRALQLIGDGFKGLRLCQLYQLPVALHRPPAPLAAAHFPFAFSPSDSRLMPAYDPSGSQSLSLKPAIEGLLHIRGNWNDDHFPNRLPKQCFGNDSDMPRIFILNFTCTRGQHAQGEYLVFNMKDFKTHEKTVVFVSAKEVVQPSLNSLLLGLLRFKAHLVENIILQIKPDALPIFL